MNRVLRTVTILDLNLPGDWKSRLASQHVRELMGSGDILQPPGVRLADNSVIWGCDRLAACHLRGDTTAEVWVCDVDEDEASEMRLVENLRRRHDNRDELKDALVALQLRRIEARAAAARDAAELPPSSGENPGNTRNKPGRPKTAKGAARDAAAAVLGTTPQAIRRAEQRTAERQRASDEQEVGVEATPPAVPGLDVATALDEIDRHLVMALAGVTRLCKAHPELVERFGVQEARWWVQQGAAALRAMAPAGQCPYCKRWPSEMPNCGACKGSGWVTAEMERDVPAELLVEGDGAGIYVGGSFVTLAELDRKRVERARDLQRPRVPESDYPKKGRGPGQSRPAGQEAERQPAGAGVPAEGRAVVEVPPKKCGAGEAAAQPPLVMAGADGGVITKSSGGQERAVAAGVITAGTPRSSPRPPGTRRVPEKKPRVRVVDEHGEPIPVEPPPAEYGWTDEAGGYPTPPAPDDDWLIAWDGEKK